MNSTVRQVAAERRHVPLVAVVAVALVGVALLVGGVWLVAAAAGPTVTVVGQAVSGALVACGGVVAIAWAVGA